ncbi:MAG TPA: HAMP domain-containing sensor histidine kinase, partial [Saprospiraceae bacterium]|nr:HAMP domain-containing sensor histidine kinase [Saprospiraceae bacterium]
IAMQSYWLIQRWTHESQSFHQTTSRALFKVAQKMADFNKSTLPKEVVKRITPNYYIVNFNDMIDANILEHYLYQEFSALANYSDDYTNFEYGIYDCSSDDMVFGNNCSLVESNIPYTATINLPKYDEYQYYFGVKFPAKGETLGTNSGLAWILALMAFVTVVFFSYAIWVIFNQRRYSEMQRDFINNMTHEFKTPLTSIQLSSDFLSKQPVIQLDERLQRYTELIRSQYQRLNTQVEKLLNIARLESAEFKLKTDMIDMHELIDEVVDSKAAEAGIRGRVFNRLYNAKHAIIKGDRTHLGSVVSNLIDNAVKYSPVEMPIDVMTSDTNGSLVVTILDHGIGIAPAHQKHLFKKFYRVPSGNVHDIKGFGLGLHYVKKILQMHKGDIVVDSELGKGSRFSFNLPVKT